MPWCSLLPISRELIQFAGYSFINDTDLIQTAKLGETYEDVASALQCFIDTWEGSLKATCWKIVQEKTFWYLIDFEWAAG